MWMAKAQLRGVQAQAGGAVRIRVIQGITQHGTSQCQHVYPQLMRATGMGIKPDQCIARLLLHDFPARLRHATLHEIDTVTWPVVPVQRQRQVHSALDRGQLAIHPGQVGFGYQTLFKKGGQATVGFGVTGQHHQSRSVIVQAVHDAHPGNPLSQPADQTVLLVFTPTRDAEHAVWLDHHHQVVILVQNINRIIIGHMHGEQSSRCDDASQHKPGVYANKNR